MDTQTQTKDKRRHNSKEK